MNIKLLNLTLALIVGVFVFTGCTSAPAEPVEDEPNNIGLGISSNYFKVIANELIPIVSTWPVKHPAGGLASSTSQFEEIIDYGLSGSGIRCIQTDNDGLLSVASDACGTGSGGGSGSGLWATTTANFLIHNTPTSYLVLIGGNASTTFGNYDLEVIGESLLDGFVSTASSTIIGDFRVDGNATTTGKYTFGSISNILNTTNHQVYFGMVADQDILIDGRTNNRTVDTGVMRFLHTPAINNTRAVTIDIANNGQENTHAFVVDYVATGLSGTASIYDANIDTANSSAGSIIRIYEASQVGAGGADVHAIHVNVGVDPVSQQSGVPEAADIGLTFDDSTSDWATTTIAFGSAGTDVAIFTEDNDVIYWGHLQQFSEIEVILDTVSGGAGVDPVFEYSNGSGGWTTLVGEDDNTQGFRQNGVIEWILENQTGWATDTVNGDDTGYYWIRITRTRNNLPTTPIEDTLLVSPTIIYAWNEDGDVNFRNLSLSGNATTSGWFNIGISDVVGNLGTLIDSGDLFVGNNATVTGSLSVGGSTLVVQNDTTRVGIGILIPDSLLTVFGDISMRNSGSFFINGSGDPNTYLRKNSSNVELRNGSDAYTEIKQWNGSADVTLQVGDTYLFELNNGSSDIFTVDDSGNATSSGWFNIGVTDIGNTIPGLIGAGDLFVGANATVTNSLTIGGNVFLQVASQDYEISGRGAFLTLQGKTSGSAGALEIYSFDGDGTDTNFFAIYGKGTPTGGTKERVSFFWNAAETVYQLKVQNPGGGGVLQPLWIGNNTFDEAIVIATAGHVTINDDGQDADFTVEASGAPNALFVQGSDGFVGIGTAAPARTLDTNGTIRSIGFDGAGSTGVGTEVDFDTGADFGRIFAFDRGGSVWKDIAVGLTGSFMVKADGKIGIATSTPAFQFQVGSLGAGTYFSVDAFGNATSSNKLVIGTDSNATSTLMLRCIQWLNVEDVAYREYVDGAGSKVLEAGNCQ